jgi:uroporphyrinogen decarboxylase
VTEYYVKRPDDWLVFIDYWEKLLSTARPTESETVAEAVRVMGEDGVPSIGLGSAFTMVACQRGMQDFIYDLHDCPELIARAHSLACDLCELAVRSFLLSPAEVAFYDVCWATGMNLGPALFDRWLGEETARMCALVREVPGKYISFYTLGRMRKVLPALVNARPFMVASFEPNEGDISLREVKQAYGDRICVMGNYDCVVLARGTEEQARAEAVRCLQEAMEGGGYILGTADEVPADARPENLRAMVQVVQEFGRYV